MRPQVPVLAPPLHGFPRVSGDAPGGGRFGLLALRFSPRERGCAGAGSGYASRPTVFPA